MQLLFAVMRGTTLAFFLLSPILVFLLCARLTSKAAAAVATLLLMLSPIYCHFSSFVRTESMAMVLILGAILWLNRGWSAGTAILTGPRGFGTTRRWRGFWPVSPPRRVYIPLPRRCPSSRSRYG
jgi:hypothetical protein